jgi:hypothetical protein
MIKVGHFSNIFMILCFPEISEEYWNLNSISLSRTSQLTSSWFPVVIIRVAKVLIINTSFLAMRLLTFAWRGANCCRGHDQLGPLVALGVNLQFRTLQASGRVLGTGVVMSVMTS